MAGHTEGPWEIDWDVAPGWPYSERVPIRHKFEGGQRTVAYVGNGARAARPARRAEIEANARLIAAAPDLLAACRQIVAAGEALHGWKAYDMARDAIAKAEGRGD